MKRIIEIGIMGTMWFFTYASTCAQSISLKYAELSGSKVMLYYDLLDSTEGRFFSVRLYQSGDNFLNPLQQVTGDIGLEVKPGRNKIITWDARKELGESFEGKVSLEIRGRIFVPFINLEQINHYDVFKRGRGYALTWSGGTPQNILNFDLFRGDQKVITFPNVANVGHHEFMFPKHLKPDKGYRFRVSDAKNHDEVVYSKPFQIKRKVPLLLKVIPAALTVATGIFLINGKAEIAGEGPISEPPKPD